MAAVLRDVTQRFEETRRRFAEMGGVPDYGTPERFAAREVDGEEE